MPCQFDGTQLSAHCTCRRKVEGTGEMRTMNDKPLALFIILCITLILPSCTPSPKAKCIDDTWSYAESVHTSIKITPNFKVTIDKFAPDTYTRSSDCEQVMIYGDKRVTYTLIVRENNVETTNYTVTKQITEVQLSQIVTILLKQIFTQSQWVAERIPYYL